MARRRGLRPRDPGRGGPVGTDVDHFSVSGLPERRHGAMVPSKNNIGFLLSLAGLEVHGVAWEPHAGARKRTLGRLDVWEANWKPKVDVDKHFVLRVPVQGVLESMGMPLVGNVR